MTMMIQRSLLVGGWLVLMAWSCSSSSSSSDISLPHSISNLAFGSCHKRKYAASSSKTNSSIWKTIQDVNSDTPLDAFVWTGDAVYPPSRGVASVEELQEEYRQLLQNESLGYRQFLQNAFPSTTSTQRVFGTWDDHDYGGNDLGVEMPDKEDRRRLFLEYFLGYNNNSDNIVLDQHHDRPGLYHSVEFGSFPNKTLLLLLDTRWNRQAHCIPSIASTVPLFGTGISCLTRWWTAGMKWCTATSRSSDSSSLLGNQQWDWLQTRLDTTDASMIVVVSSIQVLTTNPVMESWGHFPSDRAKLLNMMNRHVERKNNDRDEEETKKRSIVVLSGDVHHAEVLDPLAAASILNHNNNSIQHKQSFLEITSSGLTHSCQKPFYGVVCEPLLQTFHGHRRANKNIKNNTDARSSNYYVGINFGGLHVDWTTRAWRIQVYNEEKSVVLSTDWRGIDAMEALTEEELARVAPCVDGHLLPYARIGIATLLSILTLGAVLLVVVLAPRRRKNHGKVKRT